jgi:aryl-alcohol dehydrogenase-like predicted oxidoreductase
MQFKQFGRRGLTVSRLILGTGTFGKQTDEAEGHRILDMAAEAGVNVIDTADIYPPSSIGLSRRRNRQQRADLRSPLRIRGRLRRARLRCRS